MNKNELNTKLNELLEKYERDRRNIQREYAFSNNPYKIGDIIKDHHTTIKIEKINLHISYGEASCVYTGIQLNKDGKPSKRQDCNTIYQCNI